MNTIKRRDFFKYLGLSALSVACLSGKKASFLHAAGELDADIKLQDYVHLNTVMDSAAPMNNVGKPSGGKAKWETHKKDKKLAANTLPACSSCKFYKTPKDGYGSCAMVGANGKTPGKWVSENGWCKVWSHV